MAGPINSIFAEVTATLATIYPDAADWCSLGATELVAANVPPRIVWVPLSENYGPAVGQGGSGVSDPRPVATRQSYFNVHIWAAADPQTGQANQQALDLDACELLLNAFMWSCYAKAHGSPGALFTGTGRWGKANVDGQNLTCGVAYILPLTVNIPVTRPAQTLATINRIPATVTIGDSSVVVDIQDA